MNNSLSIKNCEPFYTEAWVSIYRFLQVTVIIDHDHGYPMISVVSSLLRRSYVVMMDGWSLIFIVIVVVRGGCLPPRMPSPFWLTGAVRARASPACRVALTLLSRQVNLLNFISWIIGPSCYWAYAIHFWALVQSNNNNIIIKMQ
jgi:hypothetical protein